MENLLSFDSHEDSCPSHKCRYINRELCVPPYVVQYIYIYIYVNVSFDETPTTTLCRDLCKCPTCCSKRQTLGETSPGNVDNL